MDIDKIILNQGYNPKTKSKMKAFFPTIIDKNGIAKENEFDEEFAMWIKVFYPYMVKYIGKQQTENILQEYTYELNVDAVANGRNSSGTCYRHEKKIVSNWAIANIHNAAIALLHEAGHAKKMFWGNDELLGAGYLDAESIFSKLDEANVSSGQNDVEFGMFSQKYMDFFGEQLNFKTKSDKYQYYQLYLECLSLLLGEHSDLLEKNATAPTFDEKDIIYQQIKMNLKNNLTTDQVDRLLDCLNGLIIHINYPQIPGDLKAKYKQLVVTMQRRTPEEFENMYEANVRLARNRGTYERTINEDADELCLVTLDVLRNRLHSTKYDKFAVLKQISRYFSNIRNSSEKLSSQTDEILELWKQEISTININLDCIGNDINNTISKDDRIVLLNYLFAIDGITMEDLASTKVFEMPKGVSSNNDPQNSVYINVGKKGMFKYFKIPPKRNTNIFFIEPEFVEDTFMRGIHFTQVDYLKEFPSGETTGELIDTIENKNKIERAINEGTTLLTGEFFNQMRTLDEKVYDQH